MNEFIKGLGPFDGYVEKLREQLRNAEKELLVCTSLYFIVNGGNFHQNVGNVEECLKR